MHLDEIERRLRSLGAAKTAELRALRREFSKGLAREPAAKVMAIARGLLRRRDNIPRDNVRRFLAYELIAHHRDARTGLREKDVLDLGAGIDNWGAVDMFAYYLSGPAWRARQVSDWLIRRWAKSPNRWWRRAALVSTVPLNSKTRGGTGDPERTLAICRLLVRDRDDMVVKALSWALRELSKRCPDAVVRFLRSHAAALAPRVRREVGTKLTTGLKNPRRQRMADRSAERLQ